MIFAPEGLLFLLKLE